jgi:hypothetical protein
MQTDIKKAGGKVPPLAGPGFLTRWADSTTADLSKRVRGASTFLKTVQPPLPEDLDENAYLNLTAYILQANGAQPGTQQLTDTTAVPIRLVTSSNPSRPASDSARRTSLSVAQQNEFTQTYCAGCHDDARKVGGLSLEHFDAAHANPTVAAMMLSKLTNGLTLSAVEAASTDAEARALLEKELKTSAIHAAGVPAPDTVAALSWINALSAETAGATEWVVGDTGRQAMLSASVVREETSQTFGDRHANIYRLALTCRPDTHEGEMQLTWAPGDVPNGREISATIDGGASITRAVEVKTWKGNRGPTRGVGSVVLYATQAHSADDKRIALPNRTLTARNILGDETVAFSFTALSQDVRRAFSTCFAVGQ